LLSRLTGNPVMRGGLVIGLGIFAGNVLGFVRTGIAAYLLGTHSLADGLAVAIGPIDTINVLLINTMVFAFVPMLTVRQGGERAALFRRAARLYAWVFCSLTAVLLLFAPELIHVLGPGLDPAVYRETVNLMRIASLSTLATGAAALHSALLYTERRFGPSAAYQSVLNIFVIAGALALWRPLGIYGFAIGYTCGAFVQYLIIAAIARRSWKRLMEMTPVPPSAGEKVGDHSTAELLSKPGSFVAYAGLLALNLIVTRGYATQAGPGMAAAFDYCLRCVNVVTAYLISPASNSLLPEIALLRIKGRARDAVRLINRTLGLVAVVAVVGCAVGIALRQPVIALLFQRGSFTAESTRMVAGVFLGFAPSMIGLSLLEISARSLFALDRRWLPVMAATVPLVVNLAVCASLHAHAPETIGLGATAGLTAGFAVLVVAIEGRKKLRA
jgi:putative peptidoglycan lipid II flippase